MLAMGVSTGPKALHVFAVYIGRNDNAEYKVSRETAMQFIFAIGKRILEKRAQCGDIDSIDRI